MAAPDLVKHDDRGQIVGVNLDIKNPHAKETVDHRSPGEIIESVLAKEQKILAMLVEVKQLVAQGFER